MWGSCSKTAPGSLSTGSPAGRTPPHGDGSMYSQANVREESVLRPPTRALPSVIVVTEKVMREADGPVGRAALIAHFGWKGDRPGVRLETEQKLARSPKITSGTLHPELRDKDRTRWCSAWQDRRKNRERRCEGQNCCPRNNTFIRGRNRCRRKSPLKNDGLTSSHTFPHARGARPA